MSPWEPILEDNKESINCFVDDSIMYTPTFLGTNLSRAMCTGCVMVGLLITAIP